MKIKGKKKTGSKEKLNLVEQQQDIIRQLSEMVYLQDCMLDANEKTDSELYDIYQYDVTNLRRAFQKNAQIRRALSQAPKDYAKKKISTIGKNLEQIGIKKAKTLAPIGWKVLTKGAELSKHRKQTAADDYCAKDGDINSLVSEYIRLVREKAPFGERQQFVIKSAKSIEEKYGVLAKNELLARIEDVSFVIG